jgi:hypothetical protein
MPLRLCRWKIVELWIGWPEIPGVGATFTALKDRAAVWKPPQREVQPC